MQVIASVTVPQAPRLRARIQRAAGYLIVLAGAAASLADLARAFA